MSSKKQKKDMPLWWHRWREAIYAWNATDPRANSLNKLGALVSATERGATVSELLTRKSIPKVDVFVAVCNVTGVSPIGILYGIDWTAKEDRFVQILASLPPEKQERLYAYLEGLAEPTQPSTSQRNEDRH